MSKLLTSLADSMKKVGVSSVYGEPVTLGDTTVVPVALGGFGFGAGQFTDEATDAADDADLPVSGGGGGGGWSVPVGAYISDERGVRFDPNLVSLAAVGIPLVWVAGKAFAKIITALKK